MGYFSRKKQAEKTANPASEKHVEGIMRRGLTESEGKPQPAAFDETDVIEGFNPYESAVDPSQRSGGKNRKKEKPAAERDWRESGFNPYDTYSNLPKTRSWDDVPFDSVDKDRRKP
ncbi:MAG: hypothetical protein WBN65_13585 [Gammaproteobacteria bacterium]